MKKVKTWVEKNDKDGKHGVQDQEKAQRFKELPSLPRDLRSVPNSKIHIGLLTTNCKVTLTPRFCFPQLYTHTHTHSIYASMYIAKEK